MITFIEHYNMLPLRRVWRYQRGNQNPYIEGQTTQWSKVTHKTKDRAGGELVCSGRVSSSCSTSGTRRVNLVTHPLNKGIAKCKKVSNDVLFLADLVGKGKLISLQNPENIQFWWEQKYHCLKISSLLLLITLHEATVLHNNLEGG